MLKGKRCSLTTALAKMTKAVDIVMPTGVFLGCLPVGADSGQWCENVSVDVVGSALMRRIPQLGEGKIYGSAEFVGRWIVGLGDKFPAAHVRARAVGEIGFASHGWRIAETAKSGGKKAAQ